jgi:hypothetical protein
MEIAPIPGTGFWGNFIGYADYRWFSAGFE